MKIHIPLIVTLPNLKTRYHKFPTTTQKLSFIISTHKNFSEKINSVLNHFTLKQHTQITVISNFVLQN